MLRTGTVSRALVSHATNWIWSRNPIWSQEPHHEWILSGEPWVILENHQVWPKTKQRKSTLKGVLLKGPIMNITANHSPIICLPWGQSSEQGRWSWIYKLKLRRQKKLNVGEVWHSLEKWTKLSNLARLFREDLMEKGRLWKMGKILGMNK